MLEIIGTVASIINITVAIVLTVMIIRGKFVGSRFKETLDKRVESTITYLVLLSHLDKLDGTIFRLRVNNDILNILNIGDSDSYTILHVRNINNKGELQVDITYSSSGKPVYYKSKITDEQIIEHVLSIKEQVKFEEMIGNKT